LHTIGVKYVSLKQKKMEEKKTSYGKLTLYYGLIVGGLLVLLSLILYISDVGRESYLNSIQYLILLGGIIWGSKTYRDMYLDGNITYGKSFSVGFMIGLFASILSSIYIFLFFQYFDPGMMTEILNNTEQNLLKANPNISDADLEMALKYSAKFTTPVMIAVWSFLANVIVSVILSLIVAIFIKRENVQTEI